MDAVRNRLRTPARIYLGLIIVTGVFSALFFVLLSTHILGDFWTYYHAGERALAGTRFVGENTGMPTGPYVYLPITVLFYLPLALLPAPIAYAVLLGVNLIGAMIVAVEVLRLCNHLEVELGRVDKGLIVGAIVLAPPLVGNLFNSQPNFWLLAALLIGYRLLEADNELVAGILIALPAIVKLWPALLGVWLLYRNAWKAVLSATATGVCAVVMSVLLFGAEQNRIYFEYILSERSRTEIFAGGVAPTSGVVTIRRPISVLFPSLDPDFMVVIGVVLLAPILGLYYYRASDSARQRLAAFEATIIVVLLILPSIPPYYIFVLAFGIPLLYSESLPHRHVVGLGLFLSVFVANASNIVTVLDFVPVVGSTAAAWTTTVLRYTSVSLVGCLLLLASLYGVVKWRD